ncbi:MULTISPECIES: acetylornithine deacetylase [unclassified Mesorhizobium]|uniref:acetylornithine deacetylase n=1 Tax=unclassified Mesorhizobium TaxID=325217 RepID=UPI000FE6F2C7|nr:MULTISPECIES: acetylornithine deacetylase [unclassified Mesorhizobium]TGV53951.1 acetylornithine deacetylase [bacterium M00.F.Ca.ET.141.01.1.1]RWC73020.1 MAG: acetylornithine deacetylase [Mesorhizobium sp.]RWC90216.1 MAG: acetylornithine deacetylase [Mesorhizobium sp.]TGT87556.1 acetylornithine deacetylase [Mesorhizobium sp. M8A.F.Ca.ET.161.01.1.1]TGV41431.1 acetylornithine deacetylase [Mesorhizobium sp. M8A.F.Ca.ET.142.01.1.1]
MDSIRILERLIAFPTVSRDSNLDLIGYVTELLEASGVACQIVRSADGHKANLFATIGPADRPGVMLSGHTDVVPVDGQNWTLPPFEMTEHDGKLYGRGAADMKGFVACALAACVKASKMALRTPLHLALSYDEEVGCLGVRDLIEMLSAAPRRPLLCIVGEPTNMRVATGHKGKLAARAICRGREGHSALAPLALNAIHLGCDFVRALRDEQERLARDGARDGDYDIPYTTVHVGKINAGVALNIVPNLCQVDFEIRNVAADNAAGILDRLRIAAARIAEDAASIAAEAAIEIEITNTYPGLDTPAASAAVAFVKSLTGANDTMKVAFGTEGGLFSRDLGTPAVVCGPGSMAQGHKPDEFVSVEQLRRCDGMLDRLLERLTDGWP